MIKEKSLVMMVGAGAAVSYMKQNPKAQADEVMRHILKKLDADRELKVFGIAGANFVLKYLESNPKASEKEVMQSLANDSQKILFSIESQEINENE